MTISSKPNGSESSLRYNQNPVIEFCTETVGATKELLFAEPVVFIVITGEICLRYGPEAYTIKAGQMGLLNRDILVEASFIKTLHINPEVDFIKCKLSITLLREFARMVAFETSPSPGFIPVKIRSLGTRLNAYVDSLAGYFMPGRKISDRLVKLKLLELLFDMVEKDSQMLYQLLSSKHQVYRCQHIVSTVNDNLLNPYSILELAQLAGRSLSSFKRDFQAIYNMAPSTWIREKRLDKAQQMIKYTPMSITQICYSLGYENTAHFSRLFKNFFGVQPKSLRSSINVNLVTVAEHIEDHVAA